MRLLVLLAVGVGFSAFGRPILSGHSSGYCGTQILSQKEIVLEPKPHEAPLPQSCEDFSGSWEGGCYDAVLKCPKVTALGDCVIPTVDEIYLDNLWVPDTDVSQPPSKGGYLFKVSQEGCGKVTLESPEGTYLAGTNTLDFSHDVVGQGHIKFRRSCEISGVTHAKWQRTIDMALYTVGDRRWSADATWLHFTSDLRGADPNYMAQFRQLRKWRLYHPGGDANLLRLDYGYFQDQRNYDPKVFEFYDPSYGGKICVWRKR